MSSQNTGDVTDFHFYVVALRQMARNIYPKRADPDTWLLTAGYLYKFHYGGPAAAVFHRVW